MNNFWRTGKSSGGILNEKRIENEKNFKIWCFILKIDDFYSFYPNTYELMG